jgi:16S rRNA (adenine1518-N6/adenine1519-N6)-dimethyltransferase
MSAKSQILEKMNALGISPKRALGQNFLINPTVIERILFAVKSCKAAHIVEIGPGLGALTEGLRVMVPSVQLIELDREFAKSWRDQGLSVFEGDALQLDWEGLELPLGTVLVSNLPYQISARITIDRSVKPDSIRHMVLMFQKEVAERITGKPGSKDYGFLSVVAQQAWKVEKVVDANAASFYPAPRVSSRVLKFTRIKPLPEDFVEFVKRAFENRRKLMLKNFPGLEPEFLLQLGEWGLGEKVRAEELSPDQFWQLFEIWRKFEH